MEIPTKYILPKANVNLGFSASRLAGAFWQVSADRPDVSYFAEINGTEAKGSLPLLEPVFVYEDQGSHLHVVADTAFLLDGSFSPAAQDLGWVSKEQLLLWSHCLVSSDGQKQNLLSLSLPQPSSLGLDQSPENYLTQDQMSCFTGPSLQKKRPQALPLFQLCFVYKREKNPLTGRVSVLLGTEARTPLSQSISSVIKGWVAEDMLTDWNQPLALSPNPAAEAVAEREMHQRPLRLFARKEDAERYRRGLAPTPGSVWWEADSVQTAGRWSRFPLLGEDEDIACVGLAGYLPPLDETAVAAQAIPSPVAEPVESLALTGGPEIIFVLGYSTSLQPFFAKLVESVQLTLANLSRKVDLPANLRYGAVVYRDFDTEVPTSAVLPLAPHPLKVIDFLQQESNTKNLGNPDPGAALYHGLRAALTQTGGQSEADRLIIVLGDVGNHSRRDPSQVSEDDLIQLLVQSEPDLYIRQLLAPQADGVYQAFIDQLQLLVKMSAIQQYQLKEGKTTYPVFYPKQSTGKWGTSISNGQTTSYLKASPTAKEPNWGQLPEEVADVIQAFLQRHPTAPSKGVSLAELVPKPAQEQEEPTPVQMPDIIPRQRDMSPFPSSVRNYLQSGYHLKQDQLNQLHQLQYPLFLTAYTPLKFDGLTAQPMQYLRFHTRQELADLLKQLDQLIAAGEAADVRTHLLEGWMKLLSGQLGYLDEKEARKMPFPQAGQLLFGIPTTHRSWGKRRLGDLESRRSISDPELQVYLRQLQDCRRELDRIFNASDDAHAFQSGLYTYYWLEEGLFP